MSRAPTPSTGGIIWKNISGHQRIAILSCGEPERGWELPIVKRDPTATKKTQDPFRDIGLMAGTEVKQPVAAETVFYPDWDPPEFVVFWHLKVKANAREYNPPDNRHVKWVTLPEAKKLLTDPAEKKLIDKISYPHETYSGHGRDVTLHYSYKSGQNPATDKNQLVRLEGDLRVHSAILEHRIREHTLEDGSIPAWGEQAGALVNMANEQMKRGNIDSAWKSLHASQRLAILGMTEPELIAQSKQLRSEAGKLNEWRRKSIYQLLGEHDNSRETRDAASVYLASELRDEHYSNNYYKYRLTQSVINNLLYWLGATVVLILTYFILTTELISGSLISVTETSRNLRLVPLLLGIVLFGLFGGVMSALFKVKSTSSELRNPELIHSHFFTSIRVFTGGAAALAFFILLESELPELIPATLQFRPTSEFTYYAISFICGFSERILLRAVSSFGDNK